MTQAPVRRPHWRNTIVGILDSALNLNDAEQLACDRIIDQLLKTLRIPDRGNPDRVPVDVMQEAQTGMYSLQMHERRRVSHSQGIRAVAPGDNVASIEAWREALMSLLDISYPDLLAEERLYAATIISDLLSQLGLPQRAAVHFPPAVIEAHLNADRA